MNRKSSMMKSIVLAAALASGVSGLAQADDSSMNMWTGDSYAYFNGGKDFPYGKPVLNYGPSTYRSTPPQEPTTFQPEHFPLDNAVDDARSTYRASYPQDPVTFQPQHFPLVNAPVATSEARAPRSPAN
jgi:hypothetical protein